MNGGLRVRAINTCTAGGWWSLFCLQVTVLGRFFCWLIKKVQTVGLMVAIGYASKAFAGAGTQAT